MASLRKKDRSDYYFACFTGPDGRRVQRSTKQVKRKQAQAVANEWEKASRLAGEKRLGEAQARRVVADIYQAISNEPLRSAVAREFLIKWAETLKVDTALRTYQAYTQVIRDFVKSLGERAGLDISQLIKADVAKYRDEVLKRTSVANANKSLKYLRVALGAAYKDGVAQENPASKLDTLRRREADRAERRPFTVKELKNVLAHTSGEWRGIILFGIYTGQRLKDIARYEQYLREDRRIAAVTSQRYASLVEPWLVERFGADPVLLSSLSAAEVVGYVRRRSDTMSRKTAKLLVCSLRSYSELGIGGIPRPACSRTPGCRRRSRWTLSDTRARRSTATTPTSRRRPSEPLFGSYPSSSEPG